MGNFAIKGKDTLYHVYTGWLKKILFLFLEASPSASKSNELIKCAFYIYNSEIVWCWIPWKIATKVKYQGFVAASLNVVLSTQ